MRKSSVVRLTLPMAISALASLGVQVSAQPVEVVDVNGVKIGDVIGVDSGFFPEPKVALDLDGRLFKVSVNPLGFQGDSLIFGTPDCTGTAFFLDTNIPLPDGTSVPPLFTPVAILPPGNTVHLPVPGLPGQPLTIGSILDDGTCQPLESPINNVPALSIQPVIDLNTRFLPPFRVQFAPPPPPPPPL